MTRNITEYMVSGDLNDILVAGNIGYTVANVPEAEDMFMRIGAGGVTSLYRAPDQDVHWEDSDTSEIPLTTTPNEILSVTIDQDMTVGDGSFVISGQASNSDNKDRVITVTVKDDGAVIATGEVNLLGDETDKLFAFSGGISSPVLSSSTITVEFEASTNGDLTLNGTSIATKIKITKALAAPVSALSEEDLKNIDFTIMIYTTNIGGSLSRSEIESAIMFNGYDLPTEDFSFKLYDTDVNVMYLIKYLKLEDEYHYEKYTKAV